MLDGGCPSPLLLLELMLTKGNWLGDKNGVAGKR